MPNTKYQQSFDPHFVKLGFIQGDGQLNRLSDERYPRHKGLEVNIGKKDQELCTCSKEMIIVRVSVKFI